MTIRAIKKSRAVKKKYDNLMWEELIKILRENYTVELFGKKQIYLYVDGDYDTDHVDIKILKSQSSINFACVELKNHPTISRAETGECWVNTLPDVIARIDKLLELVKLEKRKRKTMK